MNISEYQSFAHLSRGCLMYGGSVIGAGAAAPTIPTTVPSSSSSLAYMAASANQVSGDVGAITRTSAGLYTIKMKHIVPVVLDIILTVWGTDGKVAQVSDYVPTTRILTVRTFTATGTAATDLATTDTLKISFIALLDTPTY